MYSNVKKDSYLICPTVLSRLAFVRLIINQLLLINHIKIHLPSDLSHFDDYKKSSRSETSTRAKSSAFAL